MGIRKAELIRTEITTMEKPGQFLFKVNGVPIDERGVFTHVFERVHNGWLCINSQRTVLRQENGNKKSRPTTASEPFHIPFLSRGDKGPQ